MVSATVLRLDRTFRIESNAPAVQPTTGTNNPKRGNLISVALPPETDTSRYFNGQFILHSGGQFNFTGANSNDKVALYAEAVRSASSAHKIWAGNFNTTVKTGADAERAVGIEINVQNDDADMPLNNTNVLDGLEITGGGAKQSHSAIRVAATLSATRWRKGLWIKDDAYSDRGVEIGTFSSAGIVAPLGVQQKTDGADTIFIQRKTDAGPSGDAIRLVNAANDATLFRVDAAGKINPSGVVVDGIGFKHTRIASGTTAASLHAKRSYDTCR